MRGVDEDFECLRNGWSVGARSLLSKLKYEHFKSAEEIDADINRHIAELESLRTLMKFKFSKRGECSHAWHKSTFTIQRRILGNFVRVNERVCVLCGKLEHYQEREENGSDRPEWAINATERYFNNSI